MQKKYEISILGGYGLRNFGDDALMYILHKVISSKYEENDIAYICTPGQYLQNIINSSDVIDISNYEDLDTKLLIYGGGTQFYSFKPKNNIFYRILLNLKEPITFVNKIKNRLVKVKATKSIRINRTSTIGIGVGPFLPNADKNIELETKQLFLEMDFVGVRDVYSFEKCKEWGLTHVNQYADLCYLMNDEVKLQSKRISNEIKSIGIVVRDWNQTDEGAAYYNKILPLVDELKSKGYEVNILLFSQKRDIYWLKKLKNVDNVIIWDPDKNTILDFLQILDNFDLFITARYHGAVFSTLLGKPFISIVIEQKLEMISDVFSTSSRKWVYPFDVQKCISDVDTLNRNYAEYTKEVYSEVEVQKELSKEMMNNFFTEMELK